MERLWWLGQRQNFIPGGFLRVVAGDLGYFPTQGERSRDGARPREWPGAGVPCNPAEQTPSTQAPAPQYDKTIFQKPIPSDQLSFLSHFSGAMFGRCRSRQAVPQADAQPGPRLHFPLRHRHVAFRRVRKGAGGFDSAGSNPRRAVLPGEWPERAVPRRPGIHVDRHAGWRRNWEGSIFALQTVNLRRPSPFFQGRYERNRLH